MNLRNLFLEAIIIICLMLNSACNQADQSDSTVTKIKFDPAKAEPAYFDDITSKYYFTPLVSADTSMSIKRVDRLFVTDSLIIVGDFKRAAIFIFKTDGSLKKMIMKKGNKDDEYAHITDLNFSPERKELLVYDSQTIRVFHYTLDGICTKVDKISDPERAGLGIFQGTDMLIFDRLNVARDFNHIAIYDLQGKFLTSYMPLDNITSRLAMRTKHNLENYKNSTYYIDCLDPYIYNIAKNGYNKAYKFDVPSQYVTPQSIRTVLIKGFIDFDNTMIKNKVMYREDELFIDDNYVHFSFMFKRMPENVFYSKKTNKVLNISAFKIRNDTSKIFFPVLKAAYNGYYISTLSPELYNDFGVKSTSTNPVLMFYKIKDF